MQQVIAVDLGATKLTIAIFDSSMSLHDQKTIQVHDRDYASTIELLTNMVDEYKTKGEAVGISIAGLVDENGYISQWHNGTWNKYPLLEKLQSGVSLPFTVENDGNAAALAEWKHGNGKGINELIVLSLGTKVGTGVIHRGKLFNWHYGLTPQIGGIIQTPGGIESATYSGELASGYGLAAIAERLFDKKVTGAELAKMATSGDQKAQVAFDEVGKWIGLTVASTINLFHPEKVLLNGGLTLTYDLWQQGMNGMIEKHLLPYPLNSEVVKGAFSQNASLYGAAIKAFEIK